MLRQLFRNYKAWRVFENQAIKLNEYTPTINTISAAPRQLIKVFGPPSLSALVESSGGFDFEDQNFDYFAVYEKHSTSSTVPVNQLKRKFVIPSLKNIKLPLPSYEEFWASDLPHKFIVNCTQYADHKSFVAWVKAKIEEDVDIVASVVSEFGEVDLEDNYNKRYELRRDYAVFKYKKDYWGFD